MDENDELDRLTPGPPRAGDESDSREVARLGGVLVRAAEAIEDGAIDEAYAFALAGAEPPVVRRFLCRSCGNAFEWPGQLDDHQPVSSCESRAKAA